MAHGVERPYLPQPRIMILEWGERDAQHDVEQRSGDHRPGGNHDGRCPVALVVGCRRDPHVSSPSSCSSRFPSPAPAASTGGSGACGRRGTSPSVRRRPRRHIGASADRGSVLALIGEAVAARLPPAQRPSTITAVMGRRLGGVLVTLFGMTVVIEAAAVALSWGLEPRYDTLLYAVCWPAMVGAGAL